MRVSTFPGAMTTRDEEGKGSSEMMEDCQGKSLSRIQFSYPTLRGVPCGFLGRFLYDGGR